MSESEKFTGWDLIILLWWGGVCCFLVAWAWVDSLFLIAQMIQNHTVTRWGILSAFGRGLGWSLIGTGGFVIGYWVTEFLRGFFKGMFYKKFGKKEDG